MTTSPAGIHGPFERHELPNSRSVYYRDDYHSYWREIVWKNGGWAGKSRLTGVSTVSKVFDFRADGLMRWAARSNGEGIAMLAADGLALNDADAIRRELGFLSSADSIWRALENAGLTYEALREARATEGTNVHEHALRALALGRPVPDLAALTEEERGHARGVMAFWHECEPEAEASEVVVADVDGLGVAGRVDFRGTLLYNGLRHSAVIDCKTGKVRTPAHVQVVGYETCSVRSGWDPTDVQLLLRVDGDGHYELIPTEAAPGDFSAAVRTYRRAGQLTSRARAADKTREETREQEATAT